MILVRQNIHIGICNNAAVKEAIWKGLSTGVKKKKKKKKKALRDALTQQRCVDSYLRQQISQSDSEINSNCGKNPIND